MIKKKEDNINNILCQNKSFNFEVFVQILGAIGLVLLMVQRLEKESKLSPRKGDYIYT